MNLFELKEFFGKMHPEKTINYEFDKNCIRSIELVYIDSVMLDFFHIEYDKIKVTVDGENPIYAKIMPHRSSISKELLNEFL